MSRFVIIGAGLAGGKAVEALRDRGFDGDITLIGAEFHRPYERPPLSKDYLTGKAERTSVFLQDEAYYQGIDFVPGVEATAIDRAAKTVELADGGGVAYDKLLIATGARPRTPEGIAALTLRTVDDCDRLREVLAGDAPLTIVGAGWIGLEVAAAARGAGLPVTVLELLDLPLVRVLGPEVAQVFADLHTAHGVDLRLGLTPEQAKAAVAAAPGPVLWATGALPNVELAERAGLDVSNGIVVDASLRSSDPDIFAVGDSASAFHPLFGTHIRVEHWANALNQPEVAVAGMLGEPVAYQRLPYFYTDQYDTHWVADPDQGKRAVSPGLSMEYRGYVGPEGYDRVVFRGDVETYEFAAFWLKDGRVLAGMNVNIWDVGEPIKTLIRSGKMVLPELLADDSVTLAEIVA